MMCPCVREVQSVLLRESCDRSTAALVGVLVAETIAEEMSDIAETTYEDVEERLRVLEERGRAVELLVKARYLQCWRNQHAGLSTLLVLPLISGLTWLPPNNPNLG